MIRRLSEWWARVTGTDAQPEPERPPLTSVDYAAMQRWQATILRQMHYVDTELATLRHIVEQPRGQDDWHGDC
jgi:hypothetical protein